METTKLLLVFCEGPHDAEFLARILRVLNGCQDYTGKKLKIYPKPLGLYYENMVKSLDFLEKNKNEVFSSIPLPVILKKAETVFALIHSVGGDSKWLAAKTILQNFLDLAASTTEGSFEIYTALFYDADEQGVAVRTEKARQQLAEAFPADKATLDLLNHGQVASKTGFFIFTGPDDQTGYLEDILLPLMKMDELPDRENHWIFKYAKDFVKDFHDEKRGGKHYEKKSIIGVAGQLQHSGANLTVTISRSDYLSEEKLRNSPKTQEISQFFDAFFQIM